MNQRIKFVDGGDGLTDRIFPAFDGVLSHGGVETVQTPYILEVYGLSRITCLGPYFYQGRQHHRA